MLDVNTVITFAKWDPTNIHAHLSRCSEAQRDEIDQQITKYLVEQSLIIPRPPGNDTNDIEHLISLKCMLYYVYGEETGYKKGYEIGSMVTEK